MMVDHALGSYWKSYLEMRFNAFRSLINIIGYHTGAQLEEKYSQCNTVAEFAILWGEQIDIGARTGKLNRDAEPWIIKIEGGDTIDIRFIPSDGTGSKLKTANIIKPLMAFMQDANQISPDAPDAEEQVYMRTEVIKGKRLILVSMAELEGAARNTIIELNMYLEHPIRYFSVEELQFDPTLHKTGPKSVRVLTPGEVREFINHQLGLSYGTTRLVPDFKERLKQQPDQNSRLDFINAADEEVLSKIPTINTNDPWVRWRGYKSGDVLRIERRFGRTKVTFRRVVYLEPVAIKPPKKVIQTTKN